MTLRHQLLASTLFVGTSLLATPAFAQSVPVEATRPDAPAAVDQATVDDTTDTQTTPNDEEIVITGTLQRNPNLEQSSPVAVIGSEEIELRQSNVAEQFLRELPGAVPGVGSAVNNGNGGASTVNLRNLGENRNLVLLDGARIAPSGLGGVVDLNNIPLALIERVDILTGGASTTYGADAVAGVVNFITKDDFSGIELSASEQITERGDGNTFRADITVGANIADGRGNAVFSVGYQQADPVLQGNRDFSTNNIDSFTGGVGGSGTAVPGRFTGARRQGFDPVGANGGTLQVDPATGALVPTFSLFNFNPQNIFQTPFERFNIFGSGSYEISDGIEAYTQGLFSKNTVQTVIASSGTFGNAVTIPLSNPFLGAALRNQFCAFDTNADPAVYTPRFSQAQCDAAATATSPTDPNFRTVTSNAFRRFVEAGPRLNTYTTQIFNYKAGLRGDITDTFGYDLFGSYGESENSSRQSGNGTLTRLRQAANATNATSCIDPTNGCVPINLFGPAGSITPNQLGFLLGVTNGTITKTSLSTVRGVVSGDFGFASPAATNPISVALGGEYRKYQASIVSDQLTQTPNEVLGNGAASPDVSGGYDVKEAFAEIVAPLIEERPFFHSLTLELGGRMSDYSTSGTSYTYKAGGSWEPIRSLKIRGNYNRASRSPNIGELFAPLVTGLDNGTDPCSGAAPTLNANLRAVCLAQGAPASSIGGIDPPSANQVNITGGGNVNLNVEKATTYTIGAVFQPEFIPGLAITADYYNIKIKDLISSQTVGDAIRGCFGATPGSPPAGAATNPACLAIGRDPLDGSLNGTATGFPVPLSNLGRLATDGVDLSVNYRRRLGPAALNLSFNGNWTNSRKFNANVNSPDSINRECVGFYSVNCLSIQPEFSFNQRTSLTFGPAQLSLLWRYIDKVVYEPQQLIDDGGPDEGPLAQFRTIPEEHYFDLSARFEATDALAFTITAMNLFDNQPKVVGANVGTTAFNSGNVYPSTYDALGRRYAVGARLRF